jgi:hypothetical protein
MAAGVLVASWLLARAWAAARGAAGWAWERRGVAVDTLLAVVSRSAAEKDQDPG